MIVVSTLVAHNVAMVGRPSGGSAGRFGCRQCGWLPGLFGPHSQVIARRCGKQIHADTNIAVTDFSGTGCLSPSEDMMAMRAGLQTSPWISVDRLAKRADVPEGVRRTDTGARHKVANGFCTQIGNDRFTWFGTRPIEEPAELPRSAARRPYRLVLNSAAFDHMRDRALSAALIAAWPNNRRRRLPIRPPGRRIFTGLALPN